MTALLTFLVLSGCSLIPDGAHTPAAKAEADCIVTLTSPSDGVAAPSSPDFSWETDCDAVVLELSSSDTFDSSTTMKFGSMTQDSITLTTNRWRRAVGLMDGTMHWRVVGGQGPDATAGEFRTLALARTGDPLETPSDCSVTLSEPADGAMLDPTAAPSFAWADDCGGKVLELSASPTFDLADTIYIGAMDRDSHTLGGALWTALGSRFADGGYWRVIAGTTGGEVASEEYSFTTAESGGTTPTHPGNPPVVYYTDVVSAQLGDFVGLYGRDFGDDSGEIHFGDASAEIHSWTDTEVYAILPEGANGDLVMLTGGGSSEAISFAVHEGDKIYVSPDGDDSDPGTLEQPIRTLERANDVADPGDTILVREGTYIEEDADVGMYFQSDGETDAPITLRGYPGEEVIMDGSAAPLSVLFINSDHSVITGFTVTNAQDSGVAIWCDDIRFVNNHLYDNTGLGAGIDDAAHGVEFLGNTIHGNTSHGIYVRSNDGRYAFNDVYENDKFGIQVYDNGSEYYTNTVESNRAWNNGISGILVSQKSHDTLVQNNLSWGNEKYGIDLRYGPQGVTIIHNTTFDNDSDEIYIDDATDVVLRNNIASDDDGFMLAITSGATNVDSDNNLFSRDSFEYHGDSMDLAEFQSETGFSSNSWIADPGFVDAGSADFHLTADSPAVDSSESDYSPSYDVDFYGRDDSPDLGAYEFRAAE